ncbi:MAG: signal peptidase I, partial [Myxococcaceae bacterium]|nr:signal peptidase I [Myxococcaceae bacterium]
MAGETPSARPFAAEVLAALSEAERAAYRAAVWRERWLSLWAPVTVLGLVFLVYLAIVESAVCTYLWLQLPMKLVALACFVAWLGLLSARGALASFRTLRNARREVEETLEEALAIGKKLGPAGKGRAELATIATGLAVAYGGADADALSQAADKAGKAIEKLGLARRGGALDFASGFLKALLVALLIRTVFLEPFKIPSGSMIPTLEVGDQIFVNKFIYGVRIPFTNFVPFTLVRAPKRGDVIVFNNPVDPDKDYIKRIIGVPGDVISVEGHAVTVNGQLLASETEASPYDYWDDPSLRGWQQGRGVLEREVVDGTPHLRLLHEPARGFDGNPITVPRDSVFVMGDNRDNSEDSRYGLSRHELGVQFVPYGAIKGKAMVIWLSLS